MGWSLRSCLIVFLGLFLLRPSPAHAQLGENGREWERGMPTIRATRLSHEIVLDGILDEEAWSLAEPATLFTQLDPLEGEPGSERTKVIILYDDEALYVGAILRDRHPVSTRLGRRDGFLMESDWLTVSLDTYNDKRTGFKFEVNPSGVRGDEALSGGQDRRGDSSWDPVWQVATHIDKEGWTAEIRIPFSQLRFRNQSEQVWGIQISRDIARNREKQLFSFTPKDQAGGIARYGYLVGIEGISPAQGLEILPYVQGRAEYVPVAQDGDAGLANPFRDGSDFFFGAGVDLKYRLSSNLTLSSTFNPDFGQVEVDPAVVNLTAFETRFQEKRPFFVEGAGIFSFGQGGGGGGGGGAGGGGAGGGGGGGDDGSGTGPTQLLYSRRIGDSPPGRLPGEAVHSDKPDATTILGAAKLTGRTSGGWSVGILEAVTARQMAPYVDQSGNRGEAQVSPLSNFFVGRLRKDFRSGQSAVGGIGTAVHRDLEDPALSELLRASAYSGGIDFFHEWSNRAWSLQGQIAGSRVAGTAEVMENLQRSSARYYQRPDASHLELDPAATSLSGYTANLELHRQAGVHWRGNVLLSASSPGFEVNDLGYQRNADRREVEARIQYQETRPGDVFRRYDLSVQPRASWNFNGDRLSTNVSSRLSLTFLNYWSTNLSYQHGLATLDDRLTRGGPLAQSPATGQLTLMVSSDFTRDYSGMLTLRREWDEAGSLQHGFGGRISLKPTSTMDFSLGPRLSFSRSAAQYVTTISDPYATDTYGARYIFAGLRQTTLSLDTRMNLTFTPDLTLEIFAQPFMASGDYGTPMELAAPRTFHFNRYGIDAGTVHYDEDGYAQVDPDGPGPAQAFTISNRDFNRVSLRGTAVLRWEWSPGSQLFLVWQQSRSDRHYHGDFDFRREADSMFRSRAQNIFMVKATYWLG
jgi:hypothetical protein